MDLDLSDKDEATLKQMLEDASDYDTRSKIRAAIRQLKKSTGQSVGRRMTGSSQYRRAGFQTASSVAIPNSVTGNVYPSIVTKDGVVTKPDKNTPTIGYLNTQSTTSPARRPSGGTASPRSKDVTFSSQIGSSNESWWRKPSQESSLSATPEPEPTTTNRINSDNEASQTDQREQLNEAPTFSPEPDRKPPSPVPESPNEPSPSPEPPKEPSPSPEPPKEPSPSPEPPKEPTPSPEPPKEPTPSPEPPKEPTPSPESPKEPTPSPEPPKEPTPSPEPPKEPTPSPEPPTPSPEPPKEPTPSPEPFKQSEMVDERIGSPERTQLEESTPPPQSPEDGDEGYDEEDEELRALEEQNSVKQDKIHKVMTHTEPGLEEDLDFRKKLRKATNTKIDTTAAFPSQQAKAEQVDFRNVLKKTEGPAKKKFISGEQVDFRTNLKPKSDTPDMTRDNVVSPVHREEPTRVASPLDDYEARREARRKERQEREEREGSNEDRTTTSSTEPAAATTTADEDSYEARREARRKAREERRKACKDSDDTEQPSLTYRQRKEMEEKKMREEMKANKQKWTEMDNANGTNEKPVITKQKSSGSQQLLAWCQHKTRYYENVEVKDFSSSWSDGLALCAILHNFVPDAIPYDDLSPDNPRENYTVALKAAEEAGLERFFDVDDIILAGSPDPKSMMTFLATIYTHFK